MIHGIPRSVEVAGMFFPGRDDYLEYFGVEASEVDASLMISPEVAVSVQRDWHMRGQNGCVFAMYAARNYNDVQWSASVHAELPESDEMRTIIDAAVNDDNNQLHSLIFPNVTNRDGIYALIQRSIDAGCIVRAEDRDKVHITRLRWALDDVESWVLGFAATDDVPQSRRAPFTELVFRTKPKTKMIHPDLNNDATQAHVADLDLGFDVETVGQLMEKSTERTARILGGTAARAETHGAKAKTTYGISAVEATEE